MMVRLYTVADDTVANAVVVIIIIGRVEDIRRIEIRDEIRRFQTIVRHRRRHDGPGYRDSVVLHPTDIIYTTTVSDSVYTTERRMMPNSGRIVSRTVQT